MFNQKFNIENSSNEFEMITKNITIKGKSDLPVFKFLAKKLNDNNKVLEEINFCNNYQGEEIGHVGKMIKFYEDMCVSGEKLKQNHSESRVRNESKIRQLSNVVRPHVEKNQDENPIVSQKTDRNNCQNIDTGENIAAEVTQKINQNIKENFSNINPILQKQNFIEYTSAFCKPEISKTSNILVETPNTAHNKITQVSKREEGNIIKESFKPAEINNVNVVVRSYKRPGIINVTKLSKENLKRMKKFKRGNKDKNEDDESPDRYKNKYTR